MIPSNDNSSSGEAIPQARRRLDIDDVRNRIWDYLFKTKSTHQIEEIAKLVESDVNTVRTVIHHEWFRMAGDRASIAYVPTDAKPPRVNS
jgi:hypothetical protein